MLFRSSFRRELFVAAGGPNGGDGGKGGDIIFEVDEGLNTLADFRFVRKYCAEDGENGGTNRCTGKNGADKILKVPEGTVIKEKETGKVITDMSHENRREVILRGGHPCCTELLYPLSKTTPIQQSRFLLLKAMP